MAKKKSSRKTQKPAFRVLSLDGGGSKGVYTLGVLQALEDIIETPLQPCFDLIYGTSTGSIIAALLSCGETVQSITDEYFKRIPLIMKKRTAAGKSKALRSQAAAILGKRSFADCQSMLGIVGLNCDLFRPIVFKSSPALAREDKKSFEVGLGASLSDAVIGSCSAYPYFKKAVVKTRDGKTNVIDGGYAANNPTFFALVDATTAVGKSQREVAVLSVGTGDFPSVPPGTLKRIGHMIASNWFDVEIAETILRANANSLDQIQRFLLPQVSCLRVNKQFVEEKRQTTFLEYNEDKLRQMYRLGYESVEPHRDAVSKMLLPT